MDTCAFVTSFLKRTSAESQGASKLFIRFCCAAGQLADEKGFRARVFHSGCDTQVSSNTPDVACLTMTRQTDEACKQTKHASGSSHPTPVLRSTAVVSALPKQLVDASSS